MTPRHTLQTGITWDSVATGLVPPLEEREAARFCGYRWADWMTMTRDDRIEAIAHYRVTRLIELHQQDAVQLDHERRSKKGAGRGL